MPKQNELVGPKGNFLLGHLPEFRKDPLAFLIKCAQEQSEIVPLRMLHLPVYLFTNADHVEYVLGTHSRDFVKSRMYKLGGSIFGNGIGMSEGDFWLRQRRLIQPIFHRERISAYGQIMVDHTQQMLATWQEGQILDIPEAMLQLSMGITTRTLFNVDDASHTIGKAITVALKEIANRFSTLISLPENVPTPANLRYQRAARHLDEGIYRMIQQRRAQPEDTGDLLSLLLQARHEDGSRMTDQQLRDEMVNLIIAGFETMAVAFIWIWYVLAQYPEVEAKLLAELQAVLGERTPTVADLPKLPYTEMVLTEMLRAYPPAPMMGREATKDFELGGYHFPAGTEIWLSPWVLHHNPRYFEAPNEFRPERWEGNLLKQLPKFAYCPFSGGPRQCLGNTYAVMEAKLVLTTVIQKFQLKVVPGQVVEPDFTFTLRPKHGLKMVLAKRSLSPSAQLN